MPQDSSAENAFGARRRREPRSPPPIPDHELLRCIGLGAYGEVWLARNVMGTFRAVKILYRDDFETARPYERELEGIRKFEPVSRGHENLVDILQVGHNEPAGYFYYVMELADGEEMQNEECKMKNEAAANPTASDRQQPILNFEFYILNYRPKTLKSELNRLGHLPFSECLRLGLALTSALEHLHERGLIHRDIKPSNIIFVNGIPKLADIGLVTGFDETASFVGTEGFIPPEGAGTVQADLYSLGKVLYEISSGKDRRHFPEPATSLGEFPDRKQLLELNEIIQRACRKNSDERYVSARQMRADLVVLENGESLRGLHRTQRRLARLTRVGVVAAMVLVLVSAAYFYQRGQTRRFKQVADESRERSVRLQVANGVRAMDEGDLLTSLVWFVEALKFAGGDPAAEQVHRVRIEAVRRQCPRLIHLGVHGGPINSARFSADGRRVLTASDDHTARVWDAQTGQPASPPLQHVQPVNTAAFSPDERRILTGSADQTACLWDAVSGERVQPPMQHSSEVTCSIFSPEGKHIFTACVDGSIYFWEAEKGQRVFRIDGHKGEVNSAEFSPDGRLVVTASDDDTARVWDTRSGTPVGLPLRHADDVRYACFSPDGLLVATASRDQTAQVWSAQTGNPALPVFKHAVPLWHATFSPDGRRLLTAGGISGGPGEARVWGCDTGEAITLPLRHGAQIKHAAFSPDGRWMVTASHDSTARIWDAVSGQPVIPPVRHSQAVWAATFTPDGQRLLTAGRDRTWRLWDLSTAGLNDTPLFGGARIEQVAFSRDGSRVVGKMSSNVVMVLSASTGVAQRAMLPHRGNIESLSLSPDGRWLATACADHLVRVCVIPTGQLVCPPMKHSAEVDWVQFSPDGRVIVSGSISGTCQLWRVATGTPVGPPMTTPRRLYPVTFSPDGRYVVTYSGESKERTNGEARIWSAATGLPVTAPLNHPAAVAHAAFSPDGRRVITSCADAFAEPRAAYIWDAVSGQRLCPPLPHGAGVVHGAFSPDGRRVATAGADGIARIWDAASGLPMTPPMKHQLGANWVEFNPDGGLVVTASPARLWDANTGEAVSPPLSHPDVVAFAGFTPDGQSVLTLTVGDAARLWPVSPDLRPRQDLVMLAQLTAGVQVDQTGGMSLIEPEKLPPLLQRLRAKYPDEFALSPARSMLWHQRQAEASERAKQWYAARFHLDRLRAEKPDDENLLKRRAVAEAELSRKNNGAAKASKP